jgi:hypothetical protein
MSVRKLIYLDDETAAAARAAADAEGLSLSDWLSRAAKTACLETHQAEKPISPEGWQRADAALEELGLDLYSAGV